MFSLFRTCPGNRPLPLCRSGVGWRWGLNEFGKRLRFAFRNFPLREIHPHAEAAAETAEFAATHGKFWEMHDLIFENQSSLSEQMLGDLAHRLTLDRPALKDALGSGAFAERVQRDFSGGVRSGVNGTPTFFINSQRHDGDFERQTLLQAIQTIIHNHNE